MFNYVIYIIIYVYRQPSGPSGIHTERLSYSGDGEQRWLQI